MPTLSHNSPLKAFGTAIGDALLRALLIIVILEAGWWAPCSYLEERYSIFSQFPIPLAEAAFSSVGAKATFMAKGLACGTGVVETPQVPSRLQVGNHFILRGES